MAPTPFLGILVETGLVDEVDARALFQETGGKDFDVAKRLFETLEIAADRQLLAKLYGDRIGKAHLPLDKTLFQQEAVAKLPLEIARHQCCIAAYMMGDVLTLAMAHAEDEQLISNLEKLMRCAVSTVFAFPQEIENSIDIHYGSGAGLLQLSDRLAAGADQAGEMNAEQLQKLA